jgi:hypothetical protein
MESNFFAVCDCGSHLGTGHDGNTEQFHVVTPDEIQDRFRRVLVDISINDFVFFPAFEHSGEGHHR